MGGALVPAPWRRSGQGHVLLSRFTERFLVDQNLLAPEERAAFAGRLLAVMLVDYAVSSAGQYQELLFIPGRFHTPWGRRHRITLFYLSTEASVVNGRAGGSRQRSPRFVVDGATGRKG